MDASVDPCSDFYDYANGAWRAANPIPATMDRWSRRWAEVEATKGRLRAILEEVSARRDWPIGSIEQIIGDYYATCIDEPRANELGLAPLLPILRELDAVTSARDVSQWLARLDALAIATPLGLDGALDVHDPARAIANLSASGLGLPDRDYYLNPEPRFADAREKYRLHVAKIFALTGLSAPDAHAAAEAVFAMERQLAQASLDNVALRDPRSDDHRVTLAELSRLAPHVDWKHYLGEAHVEVSELNVEQPAFLREVDRQLARTPLATWKTYLKWKVLDSAAESLSAPFVDEDFAFFRAYLGGAKERKPRWERCVESTNEWLGEALGKKYVERYFPAAAKARMLQVLRNLLLAMRDTLEGLTWMTPETKQRALEKLAALHVQVGYPDTWKDYSSLKLGRDGLWANAATVRRFAVAESRARIGRPVDRGRWNYATPPTSNAYYDPPLNEIVFPAGILQPPAFRLDAPDAVNYGAIGVYAGHEISHAFDDEGAQYDATGRLRNWWTEADLKEFRKRSQCVVDQFEGYFIEPGIHHNGKLVLGESLSDLAGIKLAWLAFKRAQETRAPTMPTLSPFSPDQQFFISWGQFFGDAIRPETQRLMVQGDQHPISKFRVLGPLSNLSAFQETFACKDGAPMVRPTRCEVW